jgi:hypothetical protein
LESAVNDAIKWLDASQEGSKEEYEEKQKELEAISKYVFFSLIFEFVIYGLSLALSCKNSIALQVVHRVVLEVLEGSLEVAFPALASLAVSTVHTRKARARLIFFSFLAWHFLSFNFP